jgi:sensor domain CHASE-containing protein/signal transduction histidine kinase
MSIRMKAMTLIVSTMLVFLISLFLVAEYVLIDRFRELEYREANANIERIRNAIDQQFEFLEAKAADWIMWDDAYTFVQDGNEAFKSANLFDKNGENMKVNFLIYFNQTGQVMGSFGWDLQESAPLPISAEVFNFFKPDSYFLTHKSHEDTKAGFVAFAQGLAYVVAGPVVPGDHNGPIKGTMAIVKFLTPLEQKNIEELTKFKLNFHVLGKGQELDKSLSKLDLLTPENPTMIYQDNDQRFEGLTLFVDWQAEPVMVLKVLFKGEIMRHGRETIRIVLLAIGGFGTLFAIMLMLVLNRSVLNRVSDLVQDVGVIEFKDDISSRVQVVGKDEISHLAMVINRMLDVIAKNQRDLHAILDHVPSGLLRCDATGEIQSGYSNSCNEILKSDGEPSRLSGKISFKGQKIWNAIGLSMRDAESFQSFYEQIFEMEWLADQSLGNLPTRIQLGSKYLALEGSIVRSVSGSIDSILFSITDITALLAAEAEKTEHQSLIKILRNRDRFKDLCARLLNCKKLNLLPDQTSGLEETKRILHTWKGEFASFGVKDIANEIHQIEEDLTSIELLTPRVEKIQEQLNSLLIKHEEILRLNPKEMEKHSVQLDQKILWDLQSRVDQAINLEEVRPIVQDFIVATLQEEAGKTFAYLRDGAMELASRLHKQVHVTLHGENIRLPLQYAEVFSALLHIIRNALDHGIESASERQGKNPVATLAIEAEESDQQLTISISDDGRGIDLKRVKETALAKGLTTERDWQNLTTEQQIQFVTISGFSTRREVTTISGRGIGMDVVTASLKKFGGKLHISSKLGWGTTIRVQLPRQDSSFLSARKTTTVNHTGTNPGPNSTDAA